MVERLAARLGGGDEELELVLDLLLPREIREFRGAQTGFLRGVALVQGRCDESFRHNLIKLYRRMTCFPAEEVLNLISSRHIKKIAQQRENFQFLKRKRKEFEQMYDLKKARLAANTVRMLSAEAVQKAKSGHPGMPLGCADYAMTLWYKYMRHNPKNPAWIGRDRFVLSAGHGSMLEYSLLHLFEYGLSMDELKNFRQWESKTPGHPEFGHTAGVDITTGPLGTGFASAVGMAVAKRHFAAKTGLDRAGLADNKIYVISGDGCMMEGVASEAASLARAPEAR